MQSGAPTPGVCSAETVSGTVCPPPPPTVGGGQGCIRRGGTSEAAPAGWRRLPKRLGRRLEEVAQAVRQAVEGGCPSG